MKDAFSKAVHAISGKEKRFVITYGQATDIGNGVCKVIREGLSDLEEVRLNSVEKEFKSCLKITPSDMSTVGVAMIEDSTEAFIISWSEIDKIEELLDGHKRTITKEGTVWDDGKNGGMVIAPELAKQLDIMSGRIDGIIDAIKKGIPAGGSADGGTALHTSIKAELATITDKEDFTEIENDKITH